VHRTNPRTASSGPAHTHPGLPRRVAPAAAALLLATLSATPARADEPEAGVDPAKKPIPALLRPATRPYTVLIGIGPAIGINANPCYGGYFYWGELWQARPSVYRLGCGGAVKLSQEFIAHFSGGATGPALGLLLSQELPSAGGFGLTVAPKFTWDHQILPDLGLYLSPSLAFGYHRLALRGFPVVHAADVQAGVALKLSLNERWLVWLQPAHFEFIATPGFFIPRYNLLLGVGAVF